MTEITNILRPLIPILKAGKVESTYALRLTPFGKYDINNIKELLGDFEDYIFIREESKKSKEHFHCVIFDKNDEEYVRDKIRKFLLKYFIDPPKRGDANKQYNLSEIEDLELAITYLLKDGGEYFISQNIDTKIMETLKKKSYKKYSADDFKVALEILKKDFKDGEYRLDDMMIKVVQLKSLYRQPVNMNYIYQMCVSFDIHNNNRKAEEYVREFLSRFI